MIYLNRLYLHILRLIINFQTIFFLKILDKPVCPYYSSNLLQFKKISILHYYKILENRD